MICSHCGYEMRTSNYKISIDLVRESRACRKELELARRVIEAARPLGEALFLDKRIQDEARYQIRQAISAYDAAVGREGGK